MLPPENKKMKKYLPHSLRELFGQFDKWLDTKKVFRNSWSAPLIFSTVITLIFFYPSFLSGSRNAGFLLEGDVLGFYLPQILKLHSLISQWNFTALDFGQYNASADFYLAPNHFTFHPIFVLYSIITSCGEISLKMAGQLLVYALAFHSFIACYFTIRLLIIYFNFDFWMSALVAVIFAFSGHIIDAYSQPGYVFSVSTLPWICFCALEFAKKKATFSSLMIFSVPTFFCFMGGYLPLGGATLGLAVILLWVRIYFMRNNEQIYDAKTYIFIKSLVPSFLGAAIALPYLIEIVRFFNDSPSASTPSLFFSAHQLSEEPQAILRLLSHRIEIPGSFTEFSLRWGLVISAISLAFIFSPPALLKLNPGEWTILKVSAIIYALIALSIYGQFSVISDLFFYFIPVVGGMHIYQRFLLLGQFFLGILVALMLKAVLSQRRRKAVTNILAMYLCALIFGSILIAFFPTLTSKTPINNHILFELMLGILWLISTLLPSYKTCFAITTFLVMLPSLDIAYDRSQPTNKSADYLRANDLRLNQQIQDSLKEYIKRFEKNGKEIIKFVDITPRWSPDGSETFPKLFPSFVISSLSLSSYVGWNFYFSSRADYMKDVVYKADGRFYPNWENLRNGGVDFVVAMETDLPALETFTGNLSPHDIFRLPRGVVLAPLNSPTFFWATGERSRFDNGYIRMMDKMDLGQSKSQGNLSVGAKAYQSSEGGGDASRAIDGVTDGKFAGGSVTHTRSEPGAWLEIDLGQEQSISALRLWNRTEVPYRLSDYWVTVSNVSARSLKRASIPLEPSGHKNWQKKLNITPNPALTIETPGAAGRYVRIQLATSSSNTENILSLAEVEVYKKDIYINENSSSDDGSNVSVRQFVCNNANKLKFDVEILKPMTAQYLLWDSPRLNYRLNGKSFVPYKNNGLACIDLSAGRNTLEIQYRNWGLIIFWLIYGSYAIFILYTVLISFIKSIRQYLKLMTKNT